MSAKSVVMAIALKRLAHRRRFRRPRRCLYELLRYRRDRDHCSGSSVRRSNWEEDGPVGNVSAVSLLAPQLRARNEMSREQRAAVRHKHSLAVKSARFFKHLGMALTAIGFGGFLYYQV